MAEIGTDMTILAWQLQLLLKEGITEVVITTGPFAEQLECYVLQRFPEIHFIFCHNPHYDTTNYIYSIYLARDVLKDDILLMHGDLVFEENVLREIIASDTSAMVIDTTLELPEKDFKAVVKNNRITKVGIEFFESAYAAQPLYKLKKEDWIKWLENIVKFCEDGNCNVYAENAMNEISDKIFLAPYDVQGNICTEVDNLNDLSRVRRKMAPILGG